MAKFYDLLMDERREPATALRGAQTWLQRATLNDILAYIGEAESHGRIDKGDAQKLRFSVQRGSSDNPRSARSWAVTQRAVPQAAAAAPKSSERLFEHPHYWAAFYYVGF